MVCEKHTVAVFFFYLWSLIIFPNYVENVNFAAFFRRMRKNNSSLKFEIMAKQLYVASQRVL